MMGLGSPRTRTLMLTSCPSSTDWSDKDTWGNRGQRVASTICTQGHAPPPLHPGLCVPYHNRSVPGKLVRWSLPRCWEHPTSDQGVGRPDPASPGTEDHSAAVTGHCTPSTGSWGSCCLTSKVGADLKVVSGEPWAAPCSALGCSFMAGRCWGVPDSGNSSRGLRYSSSDVMGLAWPMVGGKFPCRSTAGASTEEAG